MGIVRALVKAGASLIAYDPAAMDKARATLPAGKVSFAENAYDAATGADAILILTDWEEFRVLDLERLARNVRRPILVDGRNLFSPQHAAAEGFHYYSAGRPVADPGDPAQGRPGTGARLKLLNAA